MLFFFLLSFRPTVCPVGERDERVRIVYGEDTKKCVEEEEKEKRRGDRDWGTRIRTRTEYGLTLGTEADKKCFAYSLQRLRNLS